MTLGKNHLRISKCRGLEHTEAKEANPQFIVRFRPGLLFSHKVVFNFFCNPMGCSSAASSVHEISQVRILDWVAISFSRRYC